MRYRHLPIYIIAMMMIASISAYAQKPKHKAKAPPDFVSITDENANMSTFGIKSKPHVEIQNGKFNLSVLSQTNTLLEINGIDESSLKDTILTEPAYTVLFIRSQTEKTFSSDIKNSKGLLHLECTGYKPGSPFKIIIDTKIFSEKKWLRIQSQLTGVIPEKRSTTTRKTN